MEVGLLEKFRGVGEQSGQEENLSAADLHVICGKQRFRVVNPLPLSG